MSEINDVNNRQSEKDVSKVQAKMNQEAERFSTAGEIAVSTGDLADQSDFSKVNGEFGDHIAPVSTPEEFVVQERIDYNEDDEKCQDLNGWIPQQMKDGQSLEIMPGVYAKTDDEDAYGIVVDIN